MKAVILAAGKGTRMGDLTDEMPKPMLRVHDRPILEHIITGLREVRIQEFCIITGWQAEVAPPGLFSGSIYESYGRGWLIQPEPEKDSALRMGEWNAMRIRVVGSRVTTWLNGTEMIDLVDEKIGAATGHIALQIHDGGGIKVRWRNLRIVEY